MKQNAERPIENENQLRRKYKTVKGLEKELAWLKKEQRACHFFLFHLITENPLWTNLGKRKDENLRGLSAADQDLLEKIMSQSDGPLKQADPDFSPLASELPDVLVRHTNEKLGIKTETQESTLAEKSLGANTDSCNVEQINKCISANKLPPEDIFFANGLASSHSNEMIKNSLYSIIYYLFFTCRDDVQRLRVIEKITLLWGKVKNRYPSPFSWLNSKNKQHCQWLWDEMHKRCIGIPFLPRDHIQQWHFIVATFDNWKGWTITQQAYLTEKNPKRNPGKLFPASLDSDRTEFEHKMILLDELKSAWEQKERRAKRAKEPVPARLTKAAQKKLEFIALLEGSTSKDILNELINNAFNDAKYRSQ